MTGSADNLSDVANAIEFQEVDICDAQGIPYVDQAVSYLLDHYYKPRGKELRACHPRDIVNLIRDSARYRAACSGPGSRHSSFS